MTVMRRPLVKRWNRQDALPHLVNNQKWQRGEILRGGHQGVCIPDTKPLMKMKHGGYIPAAFDPTDPNTWTGPVIFT
jgi:hypothetical protein